MTSVLLSLTIWTCSVNILNRSTAAGVYNFPSSVLFGGCVLSASKMLLYHFYKRKQEMIHDYHDRVHLQLTDLERSTLVVACIRSTYIFMRGSNAPLSEQTWASDSSTPRPIRFSWYCTTQPVTYSDQSLTLLLKKSQTFLLMIQESKEQVCGFHNSSWGTWNYDIWNKVPSGYLYFEYHLPYRWEVLASERTFRYIGLPWAGKFHICAEVRNMII